jgi:hypothetical protein
MGRFSRRLVDEKILLNKKDYNNQMSGAKEKFYKEVY